MRRPEIEAKNTDCITASLSLSQLSATKYMYVEEIAILSCVELEGKHYFRRQHYFVKKIDAEHEYGFASNFAKP